MKITPEMVAQCAKDVESEDPIDFGMLAIDEDTAFNAVALSMVERYQSLSEDTRDLVLLATATKLVVENMVLNLKLMQHK